MNAHVEHTFANAKQTFANAKQTFANAKQTFSNAKQAFSNAEQTFANAKQTFANAEQTFANAEQTFAFAKDKRGSTRMARILPLRYCIWHPLEETRAKKEEPATLMEEESQRIMASLRSIITTYLQ